jgi:hypothetical protein
MNKLATIQPSRLSGIFTLFTLISLLTSCSFTNYKNPVTELTYYATENVKTQSPPSFPGGHEKLEEFIRTDIENSPDGVKLGRKVYITAKIDEKGKVLELKPAYNADPPLEKELKRIASKMPTWQAGIVNGKGVLTDYTFLLKRNP